MSLKKIKLIKTIILISKVCLKIKLETKYNPLYNNIDNYQNKNYCLNY